jgi:hypothetical protein
MCLIAGTRRLAGPGAVSRPGSAGRCQAGTVCLIAGRAPTRRAGGGPRSGSAGCYQAGRSVLDRNVVVPGPSQPSGPAGPAERRGPAGQSAGRVSGGARRRAPRRLRQARCTDSKGTGEPGRCPVAGLGSLLGVSSHARELDGRRWRLLPRWRRARRSGRTRPFTARLRTL